MNPELQMDIAFGALEAAREHKLPIEDQLKLICRLTNPEFPKWIFEDGWLQIAVADVKPIGLELTNRESEQLAKELQEPAPASEAFKAGSKKYAEQVKPRHPSLIGTKKVGSKEIMQAFMDEPDTWFTTTAIRSKHGWYSGASAIINGFFQAGKLDRRGEKGSFEYRFAQPKNDAPEVKLEPEPLTSKPELNQSESIDRVLSPVEKAVLDYLRNQDEPKNAVVVARGIKASGVSEVIHALKFLTNAGQLKSEKQNHMEFWRIA